MLNKMKKSAQRGFTVLEILVVITIMGFLIAMVAPRLAGIADGAIDNICDTNQNRMVGYVAQYFEKANRYPTDLTNLINQDGTSYGLPATSNQNPGDGAEVFAAEFMERMQLQAHVVNADELAQMMDLGIGSVFNLNDYSGQTPTDAQPVMDPVALNAAPAGFSVAMIGMGHNGTDWVAATAERDALGEPDWFGRIVLGFSAESGLIKDGIIANAAHCPGGLQNADNATYNDYNIVLPRLEATTERMVDGSGDNATGVGATNGDLVAVGYGEDDTLAASYDVGTNSSDFKVRTFNILEAQESWQFATVCPEGHMYPADDADAWAVDISANGEIE